MAELCNISVLDINFTSNQIRIIGKGNKERIVLIDESASFKLKEYLDSRITKSDYLICNTRRKNDRPLTTHSVEKIVKQVDIDGSFKKNYSSCFKTFFCC